MAEQPAVTVVIPTLNRLLMLQQAVTAVRAQTHTNWQLVVADNGSTDGTIDWLVAEQIAWVAANPRGAGAARRAGIQASKTDLIYFLDSDDLPLPTALETLLGARLTSGAELCYGIATNQVIGDGVMLHQPAKATPAPLASSSLLHVSAIQRYGPFEDDNYSWPNWYLAAKKQGITEFPVAKQVVIRRIHGANVSSEAGAKQFYFDLIRKRLGEQ